MQSTNTAFTPDLIIVLAIRLAVVLLLLAFFYFVLASLLLLPPFHLPTSVIPTMSPTP